MPEEMLSHPMVQSNPFPNYYHMDHGLLGEMLCTSYKF